MRFTHRDLATNRIGKLPLTSMIDIVFLLLIFFLVTARFTASEAELGSALQSRSSGGGASADFQPQIVWVVMHEGAPMFRLGERMTADKSELMTVLRSLPKEGGVFVRAEGAVPVGSTAAAIQACKDAGFTSVSYVPVK